MDSKLTYNADGSLLSASGFDAVMMVRVAVLRSAIGLLEKGIQPTRGFTMKKALAMAEQYTGRKYKRTQTEECKRDLVVWIETMKSALPQETVS